MDLSQTSEVHVLRYVEMDLTLESINAMMGIEKTVMVVIKIEMLKKGLHENKMLIIFPRKTFPMKKERNKEK